MQYGLLQHRDVTVAAQYGLLQHRRIAVDAQRVGSISDKRNGINGMIYANEPSFNHYNNNNNYYTTTNNNSINGLYY